MRRLWNYFEVVFLGCFCLVSLASLETPDGLELQLHKIIISYWGGLFRLLIDRLFILDENIYIATPSNDRYDGDMAIVCRRRNHIWAPRTIGLTNT